MKPKVFQWREIKEAEAHSLGGGQALHLHQIVFHGSPGCFKRAVARGENIAHLLDQDYDRLVATAKRVGVKVMCVEYLGKPWQHVDLCGSPLKRLLAEAEGTGS